MEERQGDCRGRRKFVTQSFSFLATANLLRPTFSVAFSDASDALILQNNVDALQDTPDQVKKTAFSHREPEFPDRSVLLQQSVVVGEKTDLIADVGQLEKFSKGSQYTPNAPCVTQCMYRHQHQHQHRMEKKESKCSSDCSEQCESEPLPQGKREPEITPSKAIPGLYPRWQDDFFRVVND